MANERRDFPDWHLGRPRYLLWALDVDLPAIRRRLLLVRRSFPGLLLSGYRRQPHVTLSLCGFPSETPRRCDEFGPAALAAQIRALRDARPRPFTLEVGAPSSFSAAPFLLVREERGAIGALRACLGFASPLDRSEGYLPHVTIGLYAGVGPTGPVAARLNRLPGWSPLPCRVERISLMSYASAEIGGRLTVHADYDLVRGRFLWRGKPLFEGTEIPVQ